LNVSSSEGEQRRSDKVSVGSPLCCRAKVLLGVCMLYRNMLIQRVMVPGGGGVLRW